jgi:hypothetical protein
MVAEMGIGEATHTIWVNSHVQLILDDSTHITYMQPFLKSLEPGIYLVLVLQLVLRRVILRLAATCHCIQHRL